jgi:hypothetical protein
LALLWVTYGDLLLYDLLIYFAVCAGNQLPLKTFY